VYVYLRVCKLVIVREREREGETYHTVLRNMEFAIELSADLNIETTGETIHFLLHTDRMIDARKSSNVDLCLYMDLVFFNNIFKSNINVICHTCTSSCNNVTVTP